MSNHGVLSVPATGSPPMSEDTVERMRETVARAKSRKRTDKT
jgi:hypothetical protein